jgi:hypothetical protein
MTWLRPTSSAVIVADTGTTVPNLSLASDTGATSSIDTTTFAQFRSDGTGVSGGATSNLEVIYSNFGSTAIQFGTLRVSFSTDWKSYNAGGLAQVYLILEYSTNGVAWTTMFSAGTSGDINEIVTTPVSTVSAGVSAVATNIRVRIRIGSNGDTGSYAVMNVYDIAFEASPVALSRPQSLVDSGTTPISNPGNAIDTTGNTVDTTTSWTAPGSNTNTITVVEYYGFPNATTNLVNTAIFVTFSAAFTVPFGVGNAAGIKIEYKLDDGTGWSGSVTPTWVSMWSRSFQYPSQGSETTGGIITLTSGNIVARLTDLRIRITCYNNQPVSATNFATFYDVAIAGGSNATPLPTSGPISLFDVQNSFTGSDPIGLNEYYSGGSYVASGTTGSFGVIPPAAAISLHDFYGSSIVVSNDVTASIAPDVLVINEGGTVNFTITTTGLVSGTTLYWVLIAPGYLVTAADFIGPPNNIANNPITLINGEYTNVNPINIVNGTATITLTAANDAVTEGIETFAIRLFSGTTSNVIFATSPIITINDTSGTPASPTYAIVGTAGPVTEASVGLAYSVVTTNVPNGTILYYTFDGTNITDADFVARTGSFTVTSGVGSLLTSTVPDATTEGTESFVVNIRTGSISGPIVAVWGPVTINDTSLSAAAVVGPLSGTSFYTIPAGVTSMSIVTVAGGGGGGRAAATGTVYAEGGAGGGAGGLLYFQNYPVSPGNVIRYVTGAGGAAETDGSSTSVSIETTLGSGIFLQGWAARGGGRGGGWGNGTDAQQQGLEGGSGGGSNSAWYNPGRFGGSGTWGTSTDYLYAGGQGHAGGFATRASSSSGGGGAGGVGSDGGTSLGGPGLAVQLGLGQANSQVRNLAGGGCGNYASRTTSIDSGGLDTFGGGQGAPGQDQPGGAGTAMTGGGGGGAANGNIDNAGGNGGSGVCYLVLNPLQQASSGISTLNSVSAATQGSYSASVTFNTDGSIIYAASTGSDTTGNPNWYGPITSGVGTSWWVRATAIGLTGTGVWSGPSLGTWVQMSSSRTWTLGNGSTISRCYGQLQIDFSTTQNGTVAASHYANFNVGYTGVSGGGGGGGGCFSPETLVATPNGPRRIDSLQPGDVITSMSVDAFPDTDNLLSLYGVWHSPNLTGTMTTAAVNAVRQGTESGYYFINNALKVTWEHSIFMKRLGDWEVMRARDLMVGDVFRTETGQETTITSIDFVETTIATVNIDVASPTNTYFVDIGTGMILVHNAGNNKV